MFERYSIRARQLIFMALWSARRRRGSYIEPQDLLHALIREDRGELAAIAAEMFPVVPVPPDPLAATHPSFFSDVTAAALLQELHEDPKPLPLPTSEEKPGPAAHADMPLSRSMKDLLTSVAKAHEDDTKTVEPLDFLAAIAENRDSALAQLLLRNGITRQTVKDALDAA